MTTPSTLSASAIDEPPPYRESININERYVGWAEQQPHQNDLSFTCDGTFYFYTFFALLLHALFCLGPHGKPPHSVAPRYNPWSAATIPSSTSCGNHYATTGGCFDPGIRQLLSSHFRSLIQLTKCAPQSDIAAQATVSLERVYPFIQQATPYLLGSILKSTF
uniref:Uncharacterized protein n=1 Tax=Romanomermis culicivorax TaxID=13658 RepID=A0A915L105_ROMCU